MLLGCVCSSDFVQDFHLQSHPVVSLPPQAPVSPGLCLSANALVQCELKAKEASLSLQILWDCSKNLALLLRESVAPRHRYPQLNPSLPSLGCVSAQYPAGFLRLGAPRSTGEDLLQKHSQKYQVLANSFVANEAEAQPCPEKAFAERQAVSGEVSLLYLFPFLRTTT